MEDEERVVANSLIKGGYTTDEILEACRDESLNLELSKVEENLRRFPLGDKTPKYTGETRTRRIIELFPWNRTFTRREILETLRQEGMIGSGLLGRLNGEIILRRAHSLEDNSGRTDYYSFIKEKRSGRYSLSGASDNEF